MADRLADVPPGVLVRRVGDSWSIQENAGHLLDLEPLWLRRVEDLAAGRPDLAEADLTNRRTHEAGHNSARLEGLLADFRRAREELVRRLDAFSEGGAAVAAVHSTLLSFMVLAPKEKQRRWARGAFGATWLLSFIDGAVSDEVPATTSYRVGPHIFAIADGTPVPGLSWRQELP